MVGLVAEELPVDDAAGVDEVNFDIGRTGDFFQIQARGGEAPQRVERPALQQFGQCALQGNLETRVGTKAGEATLVLRVQQGHVHHRVLAAQRGVLDQDAEAGRAQRGNAGGNARVAGDHGLGHVGQADAFADDAALDVALENFGQACVRASTRVLPADMPLLTYRLPMMLTGKYVTTPSRSRT